jgi:NAD+ synthase (glutamine-hydrolysing)
MQWYLDGIIEPNLKITTELLDRWGLLDPKVFVDDLEWFVQGLYTNTFKRVQAPPVIVTSKSAFGFDIRESQLPWIPTRRFNRIKGEVLRLSQYSPKKS